MGLLANYTIAREPDLSLSLRGSTNGWSLLTSNNNASQITSSPAGHLLTPAQVAVILPLAAQKGTAPKGANFFDPLHDSLAKSFAADDFAAMEKTATAFLKQHPLRPLHTLGDCERQVRLFFMHKGKTSTASERRALIEGFTKEQRENWSRDAHARIDIEKAQALAAAVSGVEQPKGVDLLGGLRADLAFSVLQASYAERDPKTDKPTLANAFIDHALALHPFMPHFVFELEVCKIRRRADQQTRGKLANRLERLQQYEARLKQVVVGAVGPDHARDHSAAGMPGHTDQCDCKCSDEHCVPIDPCCGEVRHYITELLTIRDKTWCYKPSDIAYIENIAPYETRIRTHGFARTVVETSEDETNFSREESRDHQATDRFSLQQEMQSNTKASLDVDAKLHYGGKPYSADLKTDASLSKESAYREAREQVREQVEKATLKIQVQTRKLRTRTVTTEQTESNKHKFKNNTSKAAVAKYFWVSQEKRGQLFSHGPRLTIDLLVPSPAMLFTHMEAMKRKAGEPKGPPIEPQKPSIPVLNDSGQPKKDDKGNVILRDLAPADINRDNYIALAANYGIEGYDSPPPIQANQYIPFGPLKKGSSPEQISIPSGYAARKIDRGAGEIHRSFLGFARISAIFGGQSVSFNTDGNGATSATVNVVGTSQVAVGCVNASKNSSIAGTITCEPDPVDLSAWQNSIYALILKKYQENLEKYEAKLADYEAALKAYNAEQDDKIKGRHPFACEEIMRTELKRSAIFMLCGEFDWPGVMNMDSEMCHFPWPNRRKADKATNEWYFFDRGFDWNLASYIFYDYFRNPLCKWVDTFEPDEPNFLFKAFKRAGYCRIQVPVSPGMEDFVRSYIETGLIWPTPPSNPSDPHWISVVEEIKHSHDCYQQDREGYAQAFPASDGTMDSHIKVFTDRYWKIATSGPDYDAIALDLDHQIYIDGKEYRITSIEPDPFSASFSPTVPDKTSWIIGLDRKIEFAPYVDPGAAMPELKRYNYAVGDKYIGAPFHFELPTDLIWIGDQDNACLPCYPIDCACENVTGQEPGGNEGAKEDDGEKPLGEDE